MIEFADVTESEASLLYSSSDDEDALSSSASIQTTFLHSILPSLNPSRDDSRTFKTDQPRLASDIEEYKSQLGDLFDLQDKPENILLDGNGKIVAATKGKLIERLTTGADTSFTDDFLMVYRQFMASEELAQMLSYRLEQSFSSSKADVTAPAKQKLKLRTFVVLRSWIRDYYDVDFAFGDCRIKQIIMDSVQRIRTGSTAMTLSDQQILIKLRKMIINEDHLIYDSTGMSGVESETVSTIIEADPSDTLSARSERSLMSKLSSRIKTILRIKGEAVTFSDSDSFVASSIDTRCSADSRKGSLPRGALENYLRFQRHSCLSIESSGSLANALTFIESDVFASINWKDMLNYPNSLGSENADKLQRAIDHFNRVCEWIQREILRSPSHQEQSAVIKKLIRVALKCLGYCNFNTVMEIILALQHPTIQDIGPAWEKVTDYERELFNDLVDFASPLRNFRNIRKATQLQEIALTPCIPFVGLTLSDLASNDERASDHAALIPWYKHQSAARIMRQFRSFQSPERKYSLKTNPKLYEYLRESLIQMMI